MDWDPSKKTPVGSSVANRAPMKISTPEARPFFANIESEDVSQNILENRRVRQLNLNENTQVATEGTKVNSFTLNFFNPNS